MSEGAWQDAMLAAALFAVDRGLGGVSLRAPPGPLRDRFLLALRELLTDAPPFRRLPLNIADDRLLGGLDLAATLKAGRPVAARGLLAEADGGVVLLAMAERVSAAVAARLAAVLDTGEVVAERDGMALRRPAAIGIVALDEGIAEDERPPAALLDRLAFHVDLGGVSLRDAGRPEHDGGHIRAAREILPSVVLPDDLLEGLCATAAALGIASTRAALLAARTARVAAALAGRSDVMQTDALAAVRLVLASRATRFPAASAGQPDEQPDGAPEQPSDAPAEGQSEEDAAAGDRAVGELLLEAAKAVIPAGLLSQIRAGQAARAASAAGRAGAPQQSTRHGHPIGVRRGELRNGARLNLVETLRAAAPWQPIRRREPAGCQGPVPVRQRVVVTPDDFRVTRFRRRTETTTIFLVDASGSAALNRLAEAKGAVEMVLADCYVRRDRVALIAFRGTGAEVLLPPTTSLVRARRSLAGLPGGGGTPLATGIDAAFALADAVRRKGQSPIVLLLSDGRANVARDGTAGRDRAEKDALEAGRMLRAAGIGCMVVDTSPRPALQARRLAEEMGARYLPLPYADAAAVSRAVQAHA